MSRSFMGVDIGTSGVRAVIYNEELAPVSEATRSLSVLTPKPAWVEQDPKLILRAVIDVMEEVTTRTSTTGKEIAIGFSCMMHSLLACDDKMEPLDNAWLWSDLRSTAVAKRLQAEYDLTLYHRTGCPTHPAFWPSKLAWLYEERRNQWRTARYFVSLKDYVLYHLTDRLATDYSTASSTGLLALRSKQWDVELLRELRVDIGKLPPLMEPTEIIGHIKEHLVPSLAGAPVAIGGTDGTLSNVGVGATTCGDMALMIGSSAACRTISHEPKTHSRGSTWCYYLAQDIWLVGGATNNGGNILQWLQGLWPDPKPSFDELSNLAAKAPPGAEGLLFLTFLAGERSPTWNLHSRGTLMGLTISHDLPHIARAIFEGICLQATDMCQTVAEVMGMPHTVRATGGFAKSPFWLQMMADMSGLALQVTSTEQGSAFGAAVMAMVAQGYTRHFADVRGQISLAAPILPDPMANRFYQDLQAVYRQAYQRVANSFELISDWQALGQEEIDNP